MNQVSWRQVELRKQLAMFLVILGMLNIPVECAVAVGPHSLFLAPETVAELQQSGMHEPFNMPDRHAVLTRTRPEQVTGAADNHPHPAMPTPAGFASRAIPPRVIANPMAGPRLVGHISQVSTWIAPPMEHEAVGPEPPPPNLG